jgi:hypothetical protein
MAKAARLGIKYIGIRPWKEWEDQFLKKYYNEKKNVSLARTLKRSVPAILGRARMLKLTGSRSSYWTEKEKDVLRELYSDRKNSLAKISKLTGRSKYAILFQAQVLGIKRPQHDHEWTKEEHQYFVKHRKKKSYKEIAEALGLTASAVNHHASRSGLLQRLPHRPWTEEEKEYVRQNYKTISAKEIAVKLDRSYNAIITIVGMLGVSAGRPRPWSEEEKNYVHKNYGHEPIEKIATVIGRSGQAVQGLAAKLKLTKPRKRRRKKPQAPAKQELMAQTEEAPV